MIETIVIALLVVGTYLSALAMALKSLSRASLRARLEREERIDAAGGVVAPNRVGGERVHAAGRIQRPGRDISQGIDSECSVETAPPPVH